MYAAHFGLHNEPFSIAPDPRYLFMSERHREALAHLLYGVGGGGGFVLLTGEIGAGKTTICRAFLEQIPGRCNVAYIFNPKLSVLELLQSVCGEFGIVPTHEGPGAPTVKDFVDPLNAHLLRTHGLGQNNVLIIDEAQNLSADVLEQLRLLTNLETHERKLLQIMLIGQPELREMLAQPEMEQLAQRVIARFHLDALSEEETAHYIQHRLAVAGRSQGHLFDRQALKRIHALSRGVPRRINLLCDRALLGAYAGGLERVGRAQADQAAQEVFGRPAAPVRPLGYLALGATVLVAAVLIGGAALAVREQAHKPASAMSLTLALPAKPALAQSQADVALADEATLRQWAEPTETQAWQELASAWSLVLDEGDPCQAAQRQQLQCYKGSGGLALLRQLDRPAILTLLDADEQAHYVVLTGLKGDMALMRAHGQTRAVPLAVLARSWRGDMLTLWRSPAGFRSKVLPGQSGPVVDWVAQKLSLIDHGPGAAEQQRFDAKLQARVHAFQLAQGLKPDGVVGATTFMLLNKASGVVEPRLVLSGN